MQQSKGIGGHHRAFRGRSDEWLTPPKIIEALGPFDLDPCSPVERPWPTAVTHFTAAEDGLQMPWFGRVWLNPPYGPQTAHWLRKMARHHNGIALIFARTETEMFFDHVWSRAGGLLFIRGRLHFYSAAGDRADHNSGGPSVLVGYGEGNIRSLENSGIDGKFIRL